MNVSTFTMPLQRKQSLRPLSGSGLLFVFLLSCVPGPVLADTENPPAVFQCIGSFSEIQRVRDQLEVATTYLKSTKDNFGPGRGAAIEATQQANAEFEHLYGNTGLPPSPGTEKTQSLGSHGHPRMQRALQALREVSRDLATRTCQQENMLDTLRQEVSSAISAIGQAFTFNPPYSGH
jgi:hypothetical protein